MTDNNKTQPSPEEQIQQSWQELKTAFNPVVKLLKPYSVEPPLPPSWQDVRQKIMDIASQTSEHEHIHGPYTWLMNANHNALRGCQTCGQTWVGVMAGVHESKLSWHLVQEPDEEGGWEE